MDFCRWQKRRSQAHKRLMKHPVWSRKWKKHHNVAARYDDRSFTVHRPHFFAMAGILGKT